MKKNVLTPIQGYLLVSDGTKEDAEIFGEENRRYIKTKKELTYYHLDTAPIEKGTYLLVRDKIEGKDPLYELSIYHTDEPHSELIKLYKLR